MDQGTETISPSFNVTDEAAEQLKNCKPGDTFSAQLTMNDDGSYDIVSVDKGDEAEPAAEDASETAADEAEEKILGYKRPAGNHETPPLTSLTD